MNTDWTLYHGDYTKTLAHVESVDAIITDPPYSERTHNAQNKLRSDIPYLCFSRKEIFEFIDFWKEKNRGWYVIFCDDQLIVDWRDGLERIDYCAFATIPEIGINRTVRLTGDGPSSWTRWMVVARPRHDPYSHWGTLPGAYIWDAAKHRERQFLIGQKQTNIMRAIVRDYSKPGDLICDPFAGTGTTLLAAITEGRKAIGSEIDEKTYNLAKKRLNDGYTIKMFED